MAELVTVQQVEDTLGASYSGRVDIDLLIAAASAAVEDFCARTFGLADVDERLDGSGSDLLLVSRPPIVEVELVEVDGEELDNADGEAWTYKPGSRALYRGAGLLDPRRACRWPRGRGNVRVVYTGGYDAVPDPVRMATLVGIQRLADAARYSQVLTSEKIGDYQYNTSVSLVAGDELPGVARALLSPYRLRDLG